MRIVVLSGAGLSAESGIETFRAADGLWENHSVDAVATREGFTADPKLVHKFYNDRRRQLKEVKPNAAHYALAKLETMPGIELFHVTQNIDDLCERAGATNLVHMHGELLKCRCLRCAKIIQWERDVSIRIACPECGFKSEWGGIRPHIVWFGEMPLYMKEIEDALSNCDLFVAVGTSGLVYPAANFVQMVKSAKAKTLLLNKDPAANNRLFDDVIVGKASEVVPQWVESLA